MQQESCGSEQGAGNLCIMSAKSKEISDKVTFALPCCRKLADALQGIPGNKEVSSCMHGMACKPGSVPCDVSSARPENPAAAASTWLKRLAAETACSRFEVALSPSGALFQLVTRNFEWRRVDVSPGAGCTVSVLVSQHYISWLSLSAHGASAKNSGNTLRVQ